MLELFPKFCYFTERWCHGPLAALSLGPSKSHAAQDMFLHFHTYCHLDGVLGPARPLCLADGQSTNITRQSWADKMSSVLPRSVRTPALSPVCCLCSPPLSGCRWPLAWHLPARALSGLVGVAAARAPLMYKTAWRKARVGLGRSLCVPDNRWDAIMDVHRGQMAGSRGPAAAAGTFWRDENILLKTELFLCDRPFGQMSF